jgi:LPXTG-site transpeptidase (sortase) family protein
MQNQSFPQNQSDNSQIPDYLRTSSTTPIPADDNAAANLIRQKLAAIYADEPDAHQEAAEVAAMQMPMSRHQQYMQSLQASGRSWVDIQNAWHAYYQGLSDQEKHEVWQEFYAASQPTTPFQQQVYQQSQPQPQAQAQPMAYNPAPAAPTTPMPAPQPQMDTFEPAVIPAHYRTLEPTEVEPSKSELRPSVADIKKRIQQTVIGSNKLQKSDHLKSLGFGLATGAVFVFIIMFGFFNELFISPFIQPSRKASETPIIVNTADAVVGATPKVIIPKINVEIPVDYSQTTTDENAIEAALDKGIVHYPTTVMPGQAGNAAFFGHSSNNIFNPGKYKFAFVLLHKMVEGDTFYLTSGGKSYAYQVISRQVVDPTEVGVLGPVPNETATATLITCDPPGTSLKRLVVVGRQISPDPSGNAAPAGENPILATTTPTTNLPGNGPTLWSRIWNSVF